MSATGVAQEREEADGVEKLLTERQSNLNENLFDDGRVAQWLEQGAHNALVAGSIPASPTKINRQTSFL